MDGRPAHGGEPPPANRDAGGEPGPAPRGVRASDADRDAALERLSAAVGDARLTLEEYSERADRALSARTLEELEPLTGDLERTGPRAGGDAPHVLTAILGNESRKGRWQVPSQLSARSVLGDCHIDLRHATLTAPVTTIDARATFGAVTILVPEGVEVRMSGRAILGAKSCVVQGPAAPGAPVIDVRAKVFCGNVTARPPSLSEHMRERISAELMGRIGASGERTP